MAGALQATTMGAGHSLWQHPKSNDLFAVTKTKRMLKDSGSGAWGFK
jgi:hypothetical protein